MNYPKLYKFGLLLLVSISICACGSKKEHDPANPDLLINGINFVGISVDNLQDSVDFYAKSTDLSSVKSGLITSNKSFSKLAGRADLHIHTELLKSSNAQLLFMNFANQPESAKQSPAVPVNGTGIAHVCYQVNETTKTYERFLAAGAKHMGGRDMVQLNARNPVKYAYAQDLDGAVFEVEHVDVKALDLPEPPKNEYRIRHVSLATQDIGRIGKFYSKLLEQPDYRRAGRFFALRGDKLDLVSGLPGSKIKMAWFQTRNIELEIIQYVSHPTEELAKPRAIDAPGYNMIVFDVNNLQAARDKFIKAGGKIVSDVEPLLGSDIVFGRDPDGNLIGLQVTKSDDVVSSKNFLDNGI